MIYWLVGELKTYFPSLDVFHYLTLRAILIALTTLAGMLIISPILIRTMSRLKLGEVVRADGPKSHQAKEGTPTMGGISVVLVLAVNLLFWADLRNHYIWIVLFGLLSFGLLGLADDYRKLTSRKGLKAATKFFWQSVFGISIGVILYVTAAGPDETSLIVPFFKDVSLPLGAFFIFWAALVIVASSNAVNLTDGLDGLAIGTVAMIGAALGLIAYLVGHIWFSTYLYIPYILSSGELVIFGSALAAVSLGFMWFNFFPAQIFLGDVGSLSLGASLGILAVITRHEIVFFLMSGVLVLETLSVIAQVGYFKLTGKRIFRMAPFHHALELRGWHESKIVIRLWIATVVLVLFALATLKLR